MNMSQRVVELPLHELSKTEKGKNYILRNLSPDKTSNSLFLLVDVHSYCCVLSAEVKSQPASAPSSNY